MPYRLRRLDFLLGRIKELRSGDPQAVRRTLEISGVDPALVLDEADLIALRRDLADAGRRVRQAERDKGRKPGLTTDERERLKALERENKELRRANEILRKASAFFAQAEFDRREK